MRPIPQRALRNVSAASQTRLSRGSPLSFRSTSIFDGAGPPPLKKNTIPRSRSLSQLHINIPRSRVRPWLSRDLVISREYDRLAPLTFRGRSAPGGLWRRAEDGAKPRRWRSAAVTSPGGTPQLLSLQPTFFHQPDTMNSLKAWACL